MIEFFRCDRVQNLSSLFRNIPVKDQSVALNPYVKLYLLPGRASDSKRKTKVVKDSSDPIYEENFRYLLTPAELKNKKLEVVVSTRNAFYALLHGSGTVIGKVNNSKRILISKNVNHC